MTILPQGLTSYFILRIYINWYEAHGGLVYHRFNLLLFIYLLVWAFICLIDDFPNSELQCDRGIAPLIGHSSISLLFVIMDWLMYITICTTLSPFSLGFKY